MKRSRFTEEQIIRILREGAAGTKIEELCRRCNISKWIRREFQWEIQRRMFRSKLV